MNHEKSKKRVDIAARRRDIGRMYLSGKTQTEIAAVVKVTQATVSRDLKALREQWRESALIDIDKAKSKELAKIDALELTYWQAWERSCENAEIIVKKTRGKVQKRKDEDGQFIAERPAETQKTEKGQAGDPRFLSGVQWCIERRCKILGIDAPTRTELTGKDGENLTIHLKWNE